MEAIYFISFAKSGGLYTIDLLGPRIRWEDLKEWEDLSDRAKQEKKFDYVIILATQDEDLLKNYQITQEFIECL